LNITNILENNEDVNIIFGIFYFKNSKVNPAIFGTSIFLITALVYLLYSYLNRIELLGPAVTAGAM